MPNNTPPEKKKSMRLLLVLVLNTVLFFALYKLLLFYADGTDETLYSFVVMLLYAVLLVGFVLAYFIYNRFLYRKGLTVEDLPDTMTLAEKEEFIADGNRRLERSKWMMTIIFPLVFTFLMDAIDLFVLDMFR
ncbi:MAG: hypothetical protein IJW22_09400 [Clostridia bacterium]|nr:hypothetical protein [Clostridia bacterium]